MSGILFICGTPIGNLEDMTFRSLRILKEADFIACEDTRRTLQLANYFNIDTKGKLISYHEHNKISKGEYLLKLLKDNKNIALVTDAGMPIISDPGFDIVKLCYDNNINVTSAPGPTAVITGLVLSGLSAENYIFDGFLPTQNKKRNEILLSYENEYRTIILYEAPHHIKKTLLELSKVINNRQVSIVREITKKFEQVIIGTCEYLISYFEINEPKGEMVVVIEGADKSELQLKKLLKWNDISITEHMNIYLDQGFSEKDAMKAVAKDKNIGKRDVYNLIKK